LRKVKILKCSSSDWWYKDLIGKTIKIKDQEYKDDYMATLTDIDVPMTNGYLLKSDCELIQ
jgi:hypothetical protein